MDNEIKYMDFSAEPGLRSRDSLPALSSRIAVAITADDNDGKRILRLDLHDAIAKSRIGLMHGYPFPVQFRRQGALDAWRKASSTTAEGLTIWQDWGRPDRTSYEIRKEIHAYLHYYRNYADSDPQAHVWQTAARYWSLTCSTNLMFELHRGTVIEATPALETLLAHSDVDLALPMSMVVPPFAAQYLRFGPEATRLLPQPMPARPEIVFDGVFCFLSSPPKDTVCDERGGWLELIFIGKGGDRFDGHVSLNGWIDRRYATFNDWVGECLANSGVEPSHGPEDMKAFVSYVVKVFLYLTLKDARRVSHSEFSDMRLRIQGVGAKKRGKLAQRMASLYDGIVVGPTALPSPPSGTAPTHAVTPHWRRGHFRMQPHGPGNQLRKLIFVAPLLVRAERLSDETPHPRAYMASL
jgi:hypothetical protein